MTSINQWAAAIHLYSSMGIPVFPCVTGGKRPITKHGYKDATTDLNQIRTWATTHPTANLAIPTGRVSGLWVLDVDKRHGGDEQLSHFIKSHGELPPTWIASSGGGGKHFYFRYPEQLSVRSMTGILPGVDVRGDGGYVVVPPSHTDQMYRWEIHPRDMNLRDAPSSLYDLLQAPKRTGNLQRSRRSQALDDLLTISKGVHEGWRNTSATKLAGYLLSSPIDPYISRELLIGWNMRNSPPLAMSELEQVIQSIARREVTKLMKIKNNTGGKRIAGTTLE